MPNYSLEHSPVKGGDKNDDDDNPSVRLQVIVTNLNAGIPRS
jgi:hypothetical protein